MAKVHRFTNTKYPNLQIAGTLDADGKPDKPGASFVDGELITEDAKVAARVREAAKYDADLGITEGAFDENVQAPTLTDLEDLEDDQLRAMALGMGLDDSGSSGDLVERITAAQESAGRRVSVSPAIREATVPAGSVSEATEAGGSASRGDPDADPILDATVGSFPADHPDRPVDSEGQPIPVADDANPEDPAARR